MDAEDFKTMLICEETLSNRETLIDLRVADFPTIKSEERQKLHKDIYKKAYPNQKKKTLTFDDIGGILNG